MVRILESHQVRFHLTGGITTVTYGEPRMTQDIDLVIDNSRIARCVEPFLEALSASEFMFDPLSIRTAIETKQMFQLLDTVEILKLDVYPREMIPGELDRSVITEVFEGRHLPIACRADAALSKLFWIAKGSQKSRRDLRQIMRLAAEPDRQIISQMATQLELQSLLEEVLAEPDELLD